jgi:hypothetical protein
MLECEKWVKREKTVVVIYFFSPLLFIISGSAVDMFVMASFIASINGSLTSTSIVIFTLPFVSSGTQPPPCIFKFVSQFIKNVGGLFRVQINVNPCFVMKFAEPFSSGFVTKNQILLFPFLKRLPHGVRYKPWSQRFKNEGNPDKKTGKYSANLCGHSFFLKSLLETALSLRATNTVNVIVPSFLKVYAAFAT